VACYFIRRFEPRQDTLKVHPLHPVVPLVALVLAGAMLLGPVPARADRVEGLYEAEVPLEDDREAAFGAALAEVLTRVTGRRDIAGREEARELLGNAAAFAQQFRQPVPDRLWVAFDGAALEAELARLGLPVWGPDRPVTLLWVAMDAGGGRRFVVASGAELAREANLRDSLQDTAARRGIPVMFPLMDAEDRARASFAEVWGGFEDSIRAASARYGADAVLVGRLSAEDPGFGRWTLLEASGSQRWTGGAGESIERVADLFAARLAVVSSGELRPLRMSVAGIESVDDYARVMSFLARLTAVQSLSLERLEGDTATFRLALRGTTGGLAEAIALGRLLEREAAGTDGAELAYRVLR
jgi:hypothetical protein